MNDKRAHSQYLDFKEHNVKKNHEEDSSLVSFLCLSCLFSLLSLVSLLSFLAALLHYGRSRFEGEPLLNVPFSYKSQMKANIVRNPRKVKKVAISFITIYPIYCLYPTYWAFCNDSSCVLSYVICSVRMLYYKFLVVTTYIQIPTLTTKNSNQEVTILWRSK